MTHHHYRRGGGNAVLTTHTRVRFVLSERGRADPILRPKWNWAAEDRQAVVSPRLAEARVFEAQGPRARVPTGLEGGSYVHLRHDLLWSHYLCAVQSPLPDCQRLESSVLLRPRFPSASWPQIMQTRHRSGGRESVKAPEGLRCPLRARHSWSLGSDAPYKLATTWEGRGNV